MTYCKNCNAMIGDIGDPHRCPVQNNNFDFYRTLPPQPIKTNTEIIVKGQKCDLCGSTAIDHTEALCQVYRLSKRGANSRKSIKREI